MRLKSLTLKGFKSFADRAVLTLEPGITAIVGPNGSGKSNISDAVLWVLGERNAKHLRGQAMEDVIFAGSSARKATSLAEVELVLDNSDHTLSIDFDEVSIARRMYRTGESEYLINGSVARRMDVLDILHDSGLGAGTHSIISQGSIDSVLASKPEDRRALIEEAAGILKHKQRLARSSRKLERMQNHVARVTDVVGEVSRQLGPLERKAKRAKKYEELASDLAVAKLQLAVDDLRKLQVEHGKVVECVAELESSLAQRKEAIDRIDAEMEELQRKIREESEDAGTLSRQQRASASVYERIESTMALARDRRRAALERANEIEVSLESSKASLSRLEAALSQARVDLGKSQAAKDAADARAASLEEALAASNENKASLEQESAELAKRLEEGEGELGRLREEQALTKESLTNGLAHIKVLEGHAAELELLVQRSGADAKAAESEAQALEEALAAMEKQESEARNLIATCTRAREAAREALDEANCQEQSIRAQIQALDAIEQKRAASEGDARVWVDEHASELALDAEPLSHAVKAAPGLEGLVELLLGRDMAALAVAGQQEAARIVDSLSQADASGELTLLMLDDPARAKAPLAQGYDASASRRPLLESLEYPQKYAAAIQALLGDVVVCESMDDALAAHASDVQGLRFVVADGGIVWPSGKVSVGLSVLEEEQGTLARIRHLEELKASLEGAAESTRKAQDEASAAQEALSNAQGESLKLSEKLAELRGNVQSARKDAAQAAEKLASSTRELEEAGRKRQDAEATVAAARPDMQKLEQRIAEIKKESEAAKEAQRALSQRVVPLQQEAERLADDLNEARLEAAKASERKVYDERMVERHLADLQRQRQSASDAKALLAAKRASAKRLDALAGSMNVLSECAQSMVRNLEEAATLAQSSTTGLHAKTESLRKGSHDAHAAYDEASDKLSDARVEKARLEMQVESAVAEIVESCATPLETALAMPPLEDRPVVEEEAFKLNRRIANLGTINPDAAKEYDELKERYDYLAGQLADLTQAARTLTRIDRMIEARMKDDFVNTFAEINENFQDVFSMLFPGGTAHLSLEDPEDLENTGVEVNAQPAGKRIAKMSLMSGGEKSLTALALLFALYRTRPTPFYILDEVEAALDDTNLRRLSAFIDAMRTTAQLIMITHQRRTMEMADVLFGVSMQADGVTKVVSQKLDVALRHAE